MLKKRLFTALWLAPLVVFAVWFGDHQPLLTFFVALLGLLAVIEFYHMADGLKIKPQLVFGWIFTLLLIMLRDSTITGYITPYISLNNLTEALLTLGIVVSLILLLLRKQKFNAVPGWAWTWAGIFYIGWLLGYIVSLRVLDNGRNWLFLALCCTFATDTFAYFTGRAFGKHKMAPAISPAKTWEGAIGGLIGASLLGLFFLLPTPFSLSSELNWWQAPVLGISVSIFAQCGDMVESLLKRNTGVKDSGTIFPGHGGALDRMDSVVFAVVIVYYWVIWIVK